MTKNGRIATGIITVIFSLIYIFLALILYMTGSFTIPGLGPITFWTAVIIGPVGLVGGIMLLTDRTKGGILTIIAGLVSLGTQVYVALIIVTGPPYFMAIIFFIPPIIFLVAGIIGWAIASEK